MAEIAFSRAASADLADVYALSAAQFDEGGSHGRARRDGLRGGGAGGFIGPENGACF